VLRSTLRFLFRAATCLWICGLLGVLVVRGDTLRIATYNVENYGPADRMTEAGYRKEYPKPEAEKQALRVAIRGLNADVLALQEMGGSPYLEELRRDLKAEGCDYPHAALATASDADRHVAVLSRVPLHGVTTHADMTFKYLAAVETVKRGVLEVTVRSAAGDITLFVLHLKSRLTERPDDPLSTTRRGGEATAIRDRVLQRFPEPATAKFIILGDCNDHRSSRAITALQKRGKTEIATLLAATDSRGEVWTHAFRKDETYSRADYILVSPGLHGLVEGGAARIYDGEGVRGASDHRPVFVTLATGALGR
jgi:endonuclease/exonuclease/phosphatase family metal-dependent hydrolase